MARQDGSGLQSAAVRPINRPMMRAYGPMCDGSVIDPAKGQRIPDDATWIDLENRPERRKQARRALRRVQVPTREDMSEIEPSSRLYEHNGTLYMTLSALVRGGGRQSADDPIGFVLTGDRLVTTRLRDAEAVRAFIPAGASGTAHASTALS